MSDNPYIAVLLSLSSFFVILLELSFSSVAAAVLSEPFVLGPESSTKSIKSATKRLRERLDPSPLQYLALFYLRYRFLLPSMFQGTSPVQALIVFFEFARLS